jgi:hypothetical protein
MRYLMPMIVLALAVGCSKAAPEPAPTPAPVAPSGGGAAAPQPALAPAPSFAADAAAKQPAPPDATPTPPANAAVKADVGVGAKGHGYGVGPVATPISALYSVRESVPFKIQIPSAMSLYKAEKGVAPKTHEEFMKNIVEANMIKLPELPQGKRYVYHPDDEQLYVEDAPPAP